MYFSKKNFIYGICSKKDLESFNFFDLPKEIVLISISDPGSKRLNEDIYDKFNNFICLEFLDIQEPIGNNYLPISDYMAYTIKEFILNNKDKRFLINCEFGECRSPAIGLAIEYMLKYNNDLEKTLENSFILKDSRFDPNMFVFKKIIYSEKKIV